MSISVQFDGEERRIGGELELAKGRWKLLEMGEELG